ncbi:hypothetical protein, partial [Streptococcus lutetiensis]|uniref:hypothetical protein n=1 Tax=Streptococcus lutetiensis TaxID=150055 RepID=UPI001F197C4D
TRRQNVAVLCQFSDFPSPPHKRGGYFVRLSHFFYNIILTLTNVIIPAIFSLFSPNSEDQQLATAVAFSELNRSTL